MSITAAEVNKLRKQTGAGMMDCKKALTEAEGDFDKAIEILRLKGQKVAAKRGDRETSEGAVLATANAAGNFGVLVSLNCETDFVAKNEEFVSVATNIMNVALEGGITDKAALLAAGVISKPRDGVRILAKGELISEKVEIHAAGASKAAIAAVEKAGGKIVVPVAEAV